MSGFLKRIKHIADNESVKITSLERKIGASKGVLTKAINNNTDIQAKWLLLLVENYPRYNCEWLLTGRGAMLRDSESTPKQRFAEAVNYVIQHEKIMQKEIGEAIGVNPTTLNSQIKGVNNPPQNTIIALTEKYPYLSAKWILLNEGSMIIGGKEENDDKKTDKYDRLKDKYTEILEENNKYIKEIVELKEKIEKQNEQIAQLSAENLALKKSNKNRQAG